MCGIFFSISKSDYCKPDRETVERLKARGPDSYQEHSIKVFRRTTSEGSNEPEPADLYLTFVSTVLALRGDHVQAQPLIDRQTESIFCWNGEAWKFDDKDFSENDTYHIFKLLLEVLRPVSPSAPESDALNVATNEALDLLLLTFSRISGPYSFLFFDHVSSRVIYGRDCLGRRSLLNKRNGDDFVLSSVRDNSPSSTWSEVDTAGIYIIDLNTAPDQPFCLAWKAPETITSSSLPLIPIRSMNRSLPADNVPSLRHSSLAVSELLRELLLSLRLRVTNIPDPPNIATANAPLQRSKIAILFSGGLDCGVLARLVHEILPLNEPIDLLNVAFENPRVVAAANADVMASPYEACPDRITGRSTHDELLATCPDRDWRFTCINVSYAESLAHRQNIVMLLYPHSTEMDLSIGQALYFAARGKGLADQGVHGRTIYTSEARVLLSGLGADELLGGYTRHATSFSRHGFPGLIDELDLDINRIGKRNLGRDDRMISHWGKEARYPYLDESFLSWALSRPVWEKCGFGQVGGESGSCDLEPGKLVLRLLALTLGMTRLAREKKRAIQFGARTAKMESGKKKKGTDALA